MIDLQALRGAIFESGFRSIGEAGEAIGLTAPSMYRKFRTGNFTFTECDQMVRRFKIRHPEEIFKLGADI